VFHAPELATGCPWISHGTMPEHAYFLFTAKFTKILNLTCTPVDVSLYYVDLSVVVTDTTTRSKT
jgi:hypothetical protein